MPPLAGFFFNSFWLATPHPPVPFFCPALGLLMLMRQLVLVHQAETKDLHRQAESTAPWFPLFHLNWSKQRLPTNILIPSLTKSQQGQALFYKSSIATSPHPPGLAGWTASIFIADTRKLREVEDLLINGGTRMGQGPVRPPHRPRASRRSPVECWLEGICGWGMGSLNLCRWTEKKLPLLSMEVRIGEGGDPSAEVEDAGLVITTRAVA